MLVLSRLGLIVFPLDPPLGSAGVEFVFASRRFLSPRVVFEFLLFVVIMIVLIDLEPVRVFIQAFGL